MIGSQLALWQSYCEKKMECEALSDENQFLKDLLEIREGQVGGLYKLLKKVNDEAISYQMRTGEKVSWSEPVTELLDGVDKINSKIGEKEDEQ